jgi:hypothetical protein
MEDRLTAEARGDHPVDVILVGTKLRWSARQVQQLASVVGGLQDAGHEQRFVVRDPRGRGSAAPMASWRPPAPPSSAKRC